mmetsp:Transcript_35707/g.92729  ORF Transcript_35707/g.92729 Transcript_35707/m.92729 type:complete len:244 (+) Transcript_35707:698-1429(+)
MALLLLCRQCLPPDGLHDALGVRHLAPDRAHPLHVLGACHKARCVLTLGVWQVPDGRIQRQEDELALGGDRPVRGARRRCPLLGLRRGRRFRGLRCPEVAALQQALQGVGIQGGAALAEQLLQLHWQARGPGLTQELRQLPALVFACCVRARLLLAVAGRRRVALGRRLHASHGGVVPVVGPALNPNKMAHGRGGLLLCRADDVEAAGGGGLGGDAAGELLMTRTGLTRGRLLLLLDAGHSGG